MNFAEPDRPTRRQFVHRAASLVAAPAVALTARAAAEGAVETSPGEDLMREHGVLKRVMLIYEEVLRHFEKGGSVSPDLIRDAAKIIRAFIEDYHEKLEEDFYFPRFKQTPNARLAEVLLEQHLAGRKLTDLTLHLATAQSLRVATERQRLADAMRAFVRMYGPHEAQEDTVLFPEFRKLVSAHEYAALAEDFEKREREVFGAEAFETFVHRAEAIEKELGIADLAKFTPAI